MCDARLPPLVEQYSKTISLSDCLDGKREKAARSPERYLQVKRSFPAFKIFERERAEERIFSFVSLSVSLFRIFSAAAVLLP